MILDLALEPDIRLNLSISETAPPPWKQSKILSKVLSSEQSGS
jgi:hypothetical protein